MFPNRSKRMKNQEIAVLSNRRYAISIPHVNAVAPHIPLNLFFIIPYFYYNFGNIPIEFYSADRYEMLTR